MMDHEIFRRSLDTLSVFAEVRYRLTAGAGSQYTTDSIVKLEAMIAGLVDELHKQWPSWMMNART